MILLWIPYGRVEAIIHSTEENRIILISCSRAYASRWEGGLGQGILGNCCYHLTVSTCKPNSASSYDLSCMLDVHLSIYSAL